VITISGYGIEVSAPTVSQAAVLFERKRKFRSDVFWWISSRQTDLLLILDRLSTAEWIAMASCRKPLNVWHDLKKMEARNLVSQFDGFWHRTAFGNEIALATDKSCGYVVAPRNGPHPPNGGPGQ
jgi:hypothetical protein